MRKYELELTVRKTKYDGYLTIFLSLSIMVILSLILVLLQGARIGEAKMRLEIATDVSMNSVLAEYSRALYDQYSLFMVDTSYGTENPSIINTREHLRHYMSKNLGAMRLTDVDITGSSFALDGDGAVLNRQILSYMGSEPVEGLMTDVEQNADLIRDNELDTTDVEEMARANQEEIDDIELPTIINDEGEEEDITLGNPADAVTSQKHIGALALAIKDSSRISKAAVNLDEYASHRKLNKGTGLDEDEDISASERLLLEQYYYEKCSRYGAELEKSALKYQLEYMIYGKDSDFANLEKMAENLLFWREASNMLYLFGCESKVAEAELVADALTAVLFVPELAEPVKYSLLFAWTFAETISDLNILFDGGRVPLFKSDETWRLSLTGCLKFREHLSGGDLGEGLYYQDYLRARLLMTDLETKTMRLADIIEMDIRKTAGNASFKLDHCLDIFRADMSARARFGYDCKIERVYGYEL